MCTIASCYTACRFWPHVAPTVDAQPRLSNLKWSIRLFPRRLESQSYPLDRNCRCYSKISESKAPQPFFPIVRGHCSGTALVATRVSRHQPSRAIFLRRESSSKSPELKARQSRYAPWKPAWDERKARW